MENNTVTTNAECYADIIVTFGLPKIDKHDPDEETLFQQDCALFHTAHVSVNFLKHTV